MRIKSHWAGAPKGETEGRPDLVVPTANGMNPSTGREAPVRALGLFISLLLLLLGYQPAQADRRVALVIGNGAYVHAPHLPNPPHDAEDVAAALRRSGFETILGLDLDKAKMQVTVSPAPRAPTDPCASASEHWKSAEAIGTTAAFEDHLARYPNCAFAGLARARLEALKAPKAALAAPPAAAPPPNDPNRAGPDASCASEQSLKSLNGNQSITLTFQNLSNEAISAYWLDYSGKRVFYRRLNGGESYTQPTYISHPWVFVDVGGKCRRIVMPNMSQKVVAIR